MPLVASIQAAIEALHTNALDLGTAQFDLKKTARVELQNGTGNGQADVLFTDTRTLAASANEDLDLAGVLVNAFGAIATFARVKAILIQAASGNTNNIVVGAAASNAWAGFFGAGTHTLTVRPGGFFCISATDATGYAVTAGTGDLLRVANSGGGTPVTYTIVIIGASA